MYSNEQIKSLLKDLRALNAENEVVEFKEAKNNYDSRKLGKYFSALSNEANLRGVDRGWLIFGIENKAHNIVGTNFRLNRKDLDSLKKEIADKINNRFTFNEIYEVNDSNGRVILFEIPAAPHGIPVSYSGHFYARDNESLVPLNLNELETIRGQVVNEDWSAGIIEDATIEDLDRKAIVVARENFKSKFPDKSEEVDLWDDKKFLNKAKLTKKGKITRAAIILLGNEEAEHYLSPSVCKIRWILKNESGNEKDYEIFTCPMIFAVDKVADKIRNLKYRYIKDGSLFPEEVDQYDPYIIREAINNCIAHQDYTLRGRINVIEKDDTLLFTNLGKFIPESVEHVVIQDAPEEQYRNPFLANAMFHIKMVDTAGGGIRRMFNYQREKYFPLPEYDISDVKVKVTITGKVLDLKYANLLASHANLSLEDIILLDKVQKKKPITKEHARALKEKKFIEGRRPNYFISKSVSQKTNQKVAYTKNRAFDKKYYLDLILNFIKQHQTASRKDLDELLWNKLPEYYRNSKQKKSKIHNLMSELRKKGLIENIGTTTHSKWIIKN